MDRASNLLAQPLYFGVGLFMTILSFATNGWTQGPGEVHDDWRGGPNGSAVSLDHATSTEREQQTSEEVPLHLAPFTFAIDPALSRPGAWTFSYRVQGASGVDAMRPLAANLSRQGIVEGGRVSFAVTDWVEPFVVVQSHHPLTQGASNRIAGVGGAKFLFTPSDSAWNLGVEVAAMREFAGDMGTYARFTSSYDVGPLRLVGNVHVEKVFAKDRDVVDLLAFGGASVQVTEPLRLGVEYIGQDLEDAFEQEEAEGGARHYVAPVASIAMRERSVWLTGGPAFGLSQQAPAVMGRVQLIATF